jgi:PHD/YefM family antitoxin component YafN of YafNO toxin-antitoxin module
MDKRDNIIAVVEDVEANGGEFIIRDNGKPVAVVVDFERYQEMVEALNAIERSGRADAANQWVAERYPETRRD